MSNYLKLIRVKHWLKNILVFLPAFFSTVITNKNNLLLCFIAFLIFSFASSTVYVLNDINDVEKDRNHPIKKNRPLASGKVSIRGAIITIIILVLIDALLMNWFYFKTNIHATYIIPIVYVLLNILYSKYLKNIPIIDVVILVSGFVLRVMYGGAVINVEVSKYLYLMIIFGAFFLGFGKRRNEILKNGDKSRRVLHLYNKEFLDKNMYVTFALTIVAYTLWCVDPTTIDHIGNDYLFWTIPLLMVILQLYSLNIEGNSHGDPIEVILSDKTLLLTGTIYLIVMVLILYII